MFDLDGTLTDPKEGITKCVQYALAGFGISEPDLDKLTCFIGPPLKESFIQRYGLTPDEASRAVEKYRERFSAAGIFENGVYPGIPEMLGRLQNAGRSLIVASSKPTVFVLRILERYGLSGYFSHAVGSELNGERTAKAEVIREAFRQSGIRDADLEQAVMIGDREHDILGARACHIHSIGVRYGYAEPGELEQAGAEETADTVPGLERLLMP